MVTHKIIHFCTLTQSLSILGELKSASTLQFWPICKILTDLNNLCRISPDWILKKFGWEQIHPMFTRMKNVSGRQEKNADSEKWENVVKREKDGSLRISSGSVPIHCWFSTWALKCSAAQIKNATNSNSFAPWTLERTNKPTDHWIWKHWNALNEQLIRNCMISKCNKHCCYLMQRKPLTSCFIIFVSRLR